MRHTTPAALVRLNLHLRSDHVARLTTLADKLARRKGRDVRLGEALETSLAAGFAWEDHDLLDLATPDKADSPWLQMRPIHRHCGSPSMRSTPQAAALTTAYTGLAGTDQ